MNTSSFSDAQRMRSGIGADSGFALLEALVALLLFSIGILGLLGLQARAISTEGDAADRNRAALIADQCASEMQLQAGSVTMTTIAASGLANTCNSTSWADYVKGQLPAGKIVATPPTAYDIVPGGAPLAAVTVAITVTWSPPTRGAAASSAPSQLNTTTTLLVQNK